MLSLSRAFIKFIVFTSSLYFTPLNTFAQPISNETALMSWEYKLPATVNSLIFDRLPTEIWAEVTMDADWTGGPRPLLIFLHGNHGTCGRNANPRIDDSCHYTTYGHCRDVPCEQAPCPEYRIVNNHRGYRYLTSPLARSGYITVSINANRGLTCYNGTGPTGDQYLNLARGRLVLEHIKHLAQWNNAAPGAAQDPMAKFLRNAIDFSQIGLFGHSRGGEGVRAAVRQYHLPGSIWPARIGAPLSFETIVEIGPTDRTTRYDLNAEGTSWLGILPACDGDVRELAGIQVFDRSLHDQSAQNENVLAAINVFGTNHNFYNTEWQVSDSSGCLNHTALFSSTRGARLQREVAQGTVIPFFKANVGRNRPQGLNQIFDPSYALPQNLASITHIERSFAEHTDSNFAYIVDDFSMPQNHWSSDDLDYVSTTPIRHNSRVRAAKLSWRSLGAQFISRFNPVDVDWNLGGDQTLELRVARTVNGGLNIPNVPTDFQIALRDTSGRWMAPVQLSAYLDLLDPAVGPESHLVHELFQTVRIPTRDLVGSKTAQIDSFKITFNYSNRGEIYLTDLRLHNSIVGSNLTGGLNNGRMVASKDPESKGFDGALKVTDRTDRPEALMVKIIEHDGYAEVVLFKRGKFPVRNSGPVLTIGEQEFKRYGLHEDTAAVSFFISSDDWKKLDDREQFVLDYPGLGLLDYGLQQIR